MVEHLNIEQIAQASAARRLGEVPSDAVMQHLGECVECRLAVERADACLDAAAALAADDEEDAEDCPDDFELAAHLDGHGQADTARHLLTCLRCRRIVDAAGAPPTSARRPSRRWVHNLMPGVMAAAALVAVLVWSGEAVRPLTVRTHRYADIVRGETAADAEFDVDVAVEAPGVAHLLVRESTGDFTLLAMEAVDGRQTFGRYRVTPTGTAGPRTHAVVLVAAERLDARLADVDLPPVGVDDMATVCPRLVEQLACLCAVEALPVTTP